MTYIYFLSSCIGEWHKFLKKEIKGKRLSKSVFRPVNHYLTHIPLVVRNLGPMRAYSTRPLERTIGRYSKLIKSKVDTGTNAGNLVEKISIQNHIVSLIDIEAKLNPQTKASYNDKSYINCPSGKSDSSQLWSPILKKFDMNSIENDYSSLLDITISNNIIQNALIRYYNRSLPGILTLQLPNSIIDIAGRALINSTLYSSVFRRKQINEYRRGNHHIMFELPVNM